MTVVTIHFINGQFLQAKTRRSRVVAVIKLPAYCFHHLSFSDFKGVAFCPKTGDLNPMLVWVCTDLPAIPHFDYR